MVMAQSLLQALRASSPGCEIDVLAPPWSHPLIARMPQARRGIEMPVGHGELGWRARRRLGHALRAGEYDQSIVLPRSAKAALVPWLAQVPVRTGYRGEFRIGLINDRRRLDKERLPRIVERFVALAKPPDNPDNPVNEDRPQVLDPRLEVDHARKAALLARFVGAGAGSVVALIPGAEYGPAKRWPAAHFAVLARRLAAAGHRVLVLGSAKEKTLGSTIVSAAGAGAVDLCGRTTLVDVIDILAGCQALVCNDSGLMHVAAAVAVPQVAIYGSSSPRYTPPLSPVARIARIEVACSPCFRRRCPLGHSHCLTRIAVADVLASLDRLIAGSAESASAPAPG